MHVWVYCCGCAPSTGAKGHAGASAFRVARSRCARRSARTMQGELGSTRPGPPSVSFAYMGSWIAVALSHDGPVGVDIEKPSRGVLIAARRWIDETVMSEDAAAEAWAVREACWKSAPWGPSMLGGAVRHAASVDWVEAGSDRFVLAVSGESRISLGPGNHVVLNRCNDPEKGGAHNGEEDRAREGERCVVHGATAPKEHG